MNARVQWITESRVRVGLGALDDGPNLQAKALLQIWLKNNAAAAAPLPGLNYGSQPEDQAPAWGFRDGAALAAFTVWWNGQGRTPTLNALPSGMPPILDLTQDHADALNTWATENGFLPGNWTGPSPAEQPIPPFGLPPIPGFPGIPSIPPNGWVGQWPPSPPPWWPPSLGTIFPPIGSWGQGALQKPPGWELTGLPWPPPTPGATGFPGDWGKLPTGQSYPFPIPKSGFVQGGPPPEPPGPGNCPPGTVFANGLCQPLPPPKTAPAPAPAPSKASSSTGTAILFAVGLVAIVAIVVATSAVGGLPTGRDDE